jgi:hypothetical protein
VEIELPAPPVPEPDPPSTPEPPIEESINWETLAVTESQPKLRPPRSVRWPDVWIVVCLWTFVVMLLLAGYMAFRLSQLFRG